MYDKYLAINGVELLNVTRTSAYIDAFLPSLHVAHTDPMDLQAVLGHTTYKDPRQDSAPWYKPARPATAQFFGLFPGQITGLSDSSRTVKVTEMVGDGAVQSMPRNGSREMKVTALALASTDEGMAEGLAWLRDTLQFEPGDGFGRTIRMFSSAPPSKVEAAQLWRSFYRVDVIQSVKVVQEFHSTQVKARMVEFIFTLGIPWGWADPVKVAALDMSQGVAFTDPAGEDCGATAVDKIYNNFINDPFFTGIQRPPAPPTITPPNLINIESWRRQTFTIPRSQSQRWGRSAPLIYVTTGATHAENIRIRFYRVGWSGCDYEGEFLISYVPPNVTLTLDGTRRMAYVLYPNGTVVPAGHLLFGSDGKPFTWPTLQYHADYFGYADIAPGQTGINVNINTSVRE